MCKVERAHGGRRTNCGRFHGNDVDKQLQSVVHAVCYRSGSDRRSIYSVSCKLVARAGVQDATVSFNVWADCHITGATSFQTVTFMVFGRWDQSASKTDTGSLWYNTVHVFQHWWFYTSWFSPVQFPHVTGCISVISGRGGPMLSHLSAATPALCILWITMAQVAGQEDREKTTALKGKYEMTLVLLKQRRRGCNWPERGTKDVQMMWNKIMMTTYMTTSALLWWI